MEKEEPEMRLDIILGCIAGSCLGVGVSRRNTALVVAALVFEAAVIYGMASGQI